jgi:hypothetical protein
MSSAVGSIIGTQCRAQWCEYIGDRSGDVVVAPACLLAIRHPSDCHVAAPAFSCSRTQRSFAEAWRGIHHTTLFLSLDAAPTATAWGFTILVLALGTGCSEFDDADPAAYTDEEVIESTRFHGGKNLFWQNVTTGEVSAWVLNGNKVTGTQALDWRCGAGDDCVYQWRPIETGYATILWHNATSGVLQSWRFDGNGIVKADPQLTWRCDAASGCSSAWRAIGKVEFSCCDSDGLLWHNAQTGEVGAWDLAEDDYTVQGKYTLPWKCGPGDGCSQKWEAMLTADFNHDANDDVLWYNRTTGQVSAWLLKGAKITGTQELAWPCDMPPT